MADAPPVPAAVGPSGPLAPLVRSLPRRRRAGHLAVVALLAVSAEALALAGQLAPPATGWVGAGLLGARIVLSLVALLVLPGYALVAVLFPRRRDVDGFERVALAVGLSVAQVPLLALALDRLPWGLSPVSMIVAVTALTGMWCVVAASRLWYVVDSEVVDIQGIPLSWSGARHSWSTLPRMVQVSAVLGVVLLGLVGLTVVSLAVQPAVPPLTEFYMLGPEGLAEGYPRTTAPGQPVAVTVGLVNREGRPMTYRLVVRQYGAILAQTSGVQVVADGTWRGSLSFALPDYGFGQRVDLLLTRDGETEPYRRLQLVIDVPPPGSPEPIQGQQTPVPRR